MSIFKQLEVFRNFAAHPKVIFDIGACKGYWSAEAKSVLPASEFYLFEANLCHKNDLENSGFTFFDGIALSNGSKKSVRYYTGGNRTGDSYYKEMTHHYDDSEVKEIPCKTLDEMVQENNLPIPNFIKIDTQGSELDILSGASFLNKVDMIYCECPFLRYNEGAPNIQEYLDFFRSHEFVPMNIFELHHIDSALFQIDVLFMRNEVKERLFGKPKINPFN